MCAEYALNTGSLVIRHLFTHNETLDLMIRYLPTTLLSNLLALLASGSCYQVIIARK